ncbi:hypothetical protein CPB85DRAFT_1309451 [Mucidula mucida]|nr:hypothetical protein CPB85DRAFT_1309451 [Mucidula mucida]
MPAFKNPKSLPVLLPSATKENLKGLRSPKSPLPLDVPKKLTRHSTRPCRCGRNPLGCTWCIYYPEQTIVAIHDRDKFDLSRAQVTRDLIRGMLNQAQVRFSDRLIAPSPVPLNTAQTDSFGVCVEYARSLERKGRDFKAFLMQEAWIEAGSVKADCVTCAACKAEAWVAHRDGCREIDNRIVASWIEVWEIETSISLLKRRR